MTKIFTILNISSIIIGVSSLAYLLIYIDVTEVSYLYIVWFVLSFGISVWGLFSIILYQIRKIFSQKDKYQTLLIRSERQSLFLAILFCINLALQGLMVWNIFSSLLITLIIIILESYFLSQENESSKLN